MLEAIFSPLTIKQLTLKNRLVVPPMVTNFGSERGEITDRLIAYLEERAKGGFGLIIVEATAVHEGGVGFSRGLKLLDDDHTERLFALVRVLHRHGAKVAVQLYHAGRQTSSALLGTQVVSASPLPCPTTGEVPREMTTSEISEMVRCFAAAAKRAAQAGADAVEIHGAHGYLINQFVSPYSNRRGDRYGGSLEGRMRFPLEILKAVRRVVGGAFPVFYRISARERVPGGLSLEETLTILRGLAAGGADAIHVSTGVYGSMPYIVPPFSLPLGLNVGEAEAVRKHIGLPTLVAGRIVDVEMADSVVSGGRADLVAMGRASIVDPELPNKAAAGLLHEIRPCISCNQGCIGGLLGPNQEMTCLVNPAVGREQSVLSKTPVRKNILVVGAGPAGLEAARLLSIRGHKVILCERSDKPGGLFSTGALPPEKQPLARAIRWQVSEAIKAGVEIRLSSRVTRQVVEGMNPDAVVIATGSRPWIPELSTSNESSAAKAACVYAVDVLSGASPTGHKVLVMGGGGVGCETADYLLHLGKQVTVIEALHELAADLESSQRHFLLRRLRDSDCRFITDAEIVEILADGVIYRSKSGTAEPAAETLQRLAGFDTLVAALGFRPENALAQEISGIVKEVFVIGDAKEPRQAIDAIREGNEVARCI